MNEDSCDIDDVSRAASDLVAFGCKIGATQLYDSFTQLRFSEIVSDYANEIIRAVDEGVISAKQGLQELREEYSELSAKSIFYFQNGVNIASGTLQIQAGAVVLGAGRGKAGVTGAILIGHGFNNVYEGVGNIYRGPDNPSLVGPMRMAYQKILGIKNGNLGYYTVDLYLSVLGMVKLVRKPDSVQLFNKDPINYERAHKQMGTLALSFEALVDSFTLNAIIKESSLEK
ncbi:DUF4225 domain-containing protein [Pseudomonas serboccidentalis]|uniref:DUF4225 domain-containing protein n=1 Tax=Pseudomonas serboccidentalis TaxID=2964670 RepID=A0ABY7ZDF8_9PSED|nr:DUF4225 domain-containing protein [Pseudomonas serboccidentalis]WDR37657.1 DUF4225 domain-containing protein [Pseudomonas serboccidentalis]